MENKKGSTLIWILIILILLVIGLVIYFLVFNNNIDFKDAISSGEDTGGTNSQSQVTSKERESNDASSIPQPPALPSG